MKRRRRASTVDEEAIRRSVTDLYHDWVKRGRPGNTECGYTCILYDYWQTKHEREEKP